MTEGKRNKISGGFGALNMSAHQKTPSQNLNDTFLCYPHLTNTFDVPFWVPREKFFTHFSQDDLLKRSAKEHIRQVFLSSWFVYEGTTPTKFILPSAHLFKGQTEFFNGRHRIGVLLPFVEHLPIAFDGSIYNNPEFLARIDATRIGLDLQIELPNLDIINVGTHAHSNRHLKKYILENTCLF